MISLVLAACNNYDSQMVKVKGGTIIGNERYKAPLNDSVFKNGRTVTLSDFYISKYEVTQKLYKEVMESDLEVDSKPSYFKNNAESNEKQEKRPVECVTWYDAIYFCNRLSERENKTCVYTITNIQRDSRKKIVSANVVADFSQNGYRLPTEAEWEYAARGGDQTKPDWNYTFSGADDAEDRYYGDYKNEGLDIVGWYSYNNITGTTGDIDVTSNSSGCGTHQVGKKTANSLGLYDMSGNVREWCYDWYGDITEGTEIDPIGALENDARVVRGGGWGKSSNAWHASVSRRSSVYIYYRDHSLGFRVVRPATTD